MNQSKNNYYFIFIIILSLPTSWSYGQTKYQLGSYQIDPRNKIISVLTGFSGTNKEIHYWGQHYIPDSSISFNSTKLFAFGNGFVFKEHISKNRNFPSQLDINTFKIIQSDLEQYGKSICRDKNYIYRNSIGSKYQSKWDTIDISGYQTISDFIYKKDNIFYFLSKDFDLTEIEGVKLHIPTLNHVMGNFFADKNGLYLLGGYDTLQYDDQNKQWVNFSYNQSILLEKDKGEKITPIIYRDYFVYRDKVYSPTSLDANKPLLLNVKKLKELEIRNSTYANYRANFLADNDNIFVTVESGGYIPLKSRYNNHWFSNDDFFNKGVNKWQVINQRIFKNDEENTLYFPSEIKTGTGKDYAGILVEKQNEFYTFTIDENGSLKKFQHVLIFNFDTQKYEKIDLTQYRYLAEDLWIYKRHLYITDRGLPVKEPIETENLHFLTLHDVKTNYLTNGKSIVYVGNITGYNTIGDNGRAMQVLGNRIYYEIDPANLKVISADILIDDKNIYTGNHDGINVVPIKETGIYIKAFTE